ncbi:MAG: substrate-binding domain-containing protein [Betaproteobacteria bacterium]
MTAVADLRVLSGGAAKGLVAALDGAIRAQVGAGIAGTFGAVGAMRERLLAGEPCDVVILTASVVDALTADGCLVAGASAPLGRVHTGIAVRSGDPLPRIDDRTSLAAALRAADGIYFPDPQRATAGIHFDNVLQALGIRTEVTPHLKPYPNGATAMLNLARAVEPIAIGCTQVTEILYTDGVQLVGRLPPEFELATVYTAAVCSRAADPRRARQLVSLLSGADSAALRARGGFES